MPRPVYEYDDIEAAQDAVDAWKDQNKVLFPGDGIKDKQLLETWAGGVKANVKGSAGPAGKFDVSGTVMANYTENKKTHDKRMAS